MVKIGNIYSRINLREYHLIVSDSIYIFLLLLKGNTFERFVIIYISDYIRSNNLKKLKVSAVKPVPAIFSNSMTIKITQCSGLKNNMHTQTT